MIPSMRHTNGRNSMLQWHSKVTMLVVIAALVAISGLLANFTWILNFTW